MTPATASAWIADRLSRAPLDGRARSRAPGDDATRCRPAGCSARPGGGGRLTLEQRLDSVWEGLRADGAAECPVCHGRMQGMGPARCASCGSELY
ncbi:MAG: hypothetical protein WD993_03375 [Thermoleophilaceae bacterium]